MSHQARVDSTVALKQFRAALCKFAEAVGGALDEAEGEVRRTEDWVRSDQPNYWKQQIRKRTELYTRAKSALTRKKLMPSATGTPHAAIEEERALALAQRQLEEAKQKLENVKKWRRRLEEETHAYRAATQSLGLMIQADVPTATAQLDNMVAALEEYATAPPGEVRSVAASAEPSATAAASPTGSMARGTAPAGDETLGRYRRLRTHVPSPALRAALPLDDDAFHWEVTLDDKMLRAAIVDITPNRTPIAPDTRIVFARDVRDCDEVFLARVEPANEDDSGWFIAGTNDAGTAACRAVRAADLLAARPELDAVLQLPVGYLVVLNRTALAAVLDPQNVCCWPVAGPSGDAQ